MKGKFREGRVIEVKGELVVTTGNSAVEVQNLFGAELMSRWLRFAAVSPKSAVTYKGALKALFRYLATNDINKPTREDLEDWRDSLRDAGKSPSTISLYLSSTKLFFRWLAQEGLYTNISDNLKNRTKISHDHKREALTANQARLLFNAVKGDSVKAKRDRAILALMTTAGLRTVEVERAAIEDLYHVSGACFLRLQGKGRGGKDQRVRIAPRVEALIRDYLASRPNAVGSDPLFVSTSRRNAGEGVSTQTVRKMVKHYLREIGLDDRRYSAHSLRHTSATIMLLNGATLEQTQQILRHVNIATTMIYLHHVERLKNDGELRAANAIFGVGNR